MSYPVPRQVLFIDKVGMAYQPEFLSFMEVTSSVFVIAGYPFSRRKLSSQNVQKNTSCSKNDIYFK